jgi:hypothetical protein
MVDRSHVGVKEPLTEPVSAYDGPIYYDLPVADPCFGGRFPIPATSYAAVGSTPWRIAGIQFAARRAKRVPVVSVS